MKIITINVPESFIQSMDKLVGDHMVYPSRSELVRVAVREFLIKEAEALKALNQLTAKNSKLETESEIFIQVPIQKRGF